MSAVIYAAIVVMWAVVLVPMWLRRHDAATETRSVDRFSTAMRTLSRRTSATPGRRYVVMPRRSEGGPTVHVSGAAATRPPRRSESARPAAPRPARGRASLVARRRRLLLGLLAVTFVTFVLAAAGMLSWVLQLLVDVLLVGFCLHLRAQARRAAELARRRRGVSERPARRPAPVATPAMAQPRVAYESSRTVLAPTGTDGDVDPTADVATDGDAQTWDPVPVPRPTYTMKPPAPAYEADPTYSPPVYDPAAATAAAAASSEGVAETETDLEDILDRRWAVND